MMTHTLPVGGGDSTTTLFSLSEEEDGDMEVTEEGGGGDLAADNLTTDSASVAVVTTTTTKRSGSSSSKSSSSSSKPTKRTRVVTDAIFERNKYVLATVLSSDIKRILTKILWGQEGYWNKTFFRAPVRAEVLLWLIRKPMPELLIVKNIMDRVEEADCCNQFVAKLIRSGAMSARLKSKVVAICQNKYLPPVPRFMIQLVRNRNVADQEKLLKALDVGPYYDENEEEEDNDDDDNDNDDADDEDDDDDRFVAKYLRDDVTLERGLSRWILKKQRSKDYNAHCDTLGQDSNALADFERGITNTAKMPLLKLSPNVARAIHNTCGQAKLCQLVRKMRQDLGLVWEGDGEEESFFSDNAASSRRRLSGLITDWLLARQRQGLISNHLKCQIMCYVYVLDLDKPSGLLASSSMGGGHHPQDEPPNWRLGWEDLERRVRSFGKEWARRHNQSALSMAQSGFRLLSLRPEMNPSHNVVICYQCWIGLKKWRADDDPDLEHLWRTCEDRRQCPYLLKKLGRPMVNFIEGLQKVGDLKPRDMNHARDLYAAQLF